MAFSALINLALTGIGYLMGGCWLSFLRVSGIFQAQPSQCHLNPTLRESGYSQAEKQRMIKGVVRSESSLHLPDLFCQARAASELLPFKLGSSSGENRKHQSCSEVLQSSHPLEH